MKPLFQKAIINFIFLLFTANFLSAQSLINKENIYIFIDFEEEIQSITYLSKTKDLRNSTVEFSFLKSNNDRIIFNCLYKPKSIKLNEKELKKFNILQISRIADTDIVTFLKSLNNTKIFVLEKIEDDKYKLHPIESYSYIEREQY